jgi:hypothetical protein
MLFLAIIFGVVGALVAVFGTLLLRGDLGIRPPRALDPEYRHREVINCGVMVSLGMKAGSVGGGVGAVVGVVVHILLF